MRLISKWGEYDADYGTVLINKGDGNFSCSLLNGYTDTRELRTY
jgi:hypothetical protein